MAQPLEQCSDAQLLERLAAGHSEALGQLYLRHTDCIYRVALRYSRNRTDAEDAVQSAFLSLLKQKDAAASYRGGSSVKVWLMSVVLNNCKLQARTAVRRKHHEETLAVGIEQDMRGKPDERADAVLEKVQALPDDLRLPLWLHYLERLTFREVGQVLGLREDAAEKRVSRGLDKLRGALVSSGVSAAAVPVMLASLSLEAAPPKLVAAVRAATSAANAGAANAVGVSKLSASAISFLGGTAMKITAVVLLASAATASSVVLSKRGDSAETGRPAPRTGATAGDESATPKGDPKAPLGSPSYYPSLERPTGWRGDNSGRYPGATPPVTWTKENVLWHSPPFEKWGKPMGNPIIVGDRIFLSTQPTTLVCLSKLDGHILWMRSNNYFDATPEVERKANPAFADTIAPLAAKLRQIEDAIAKESGSGKSDKLKGMVEEREKLDDQIYEAIHLLDKQYARPHPDHPTAPTPCSDGKHVYMWTGHGVAACYDLDGNRLWCTYANRCPNGGGHHGSHGSPVVVGDKMLAFIQDLIAFDTKTGAVAWVTPIEVVGGYNFSLPIVSCDGQPTAMVIKAEKCMVGIRVADGKEVWASQTFSADGQQFPWTEGSSVLNEGVCYWPGGRGVVVFRYPKKSGEKGSLIFNREFKDNALACASGLYDDGLVYCVYPDGTLRVFDAATAKTVYTQTLGIARKDDGFYPSLTMAGQHIYVTNNNGDTEVIAPGRVFKSEAINKAWPGESTWANLVFEGTRLYYRTGAGLYCIGVK